MALEIGQSVGEHEILALQGAIPAAVLPAPVNPPNKSQRGLWLGLGAAAAIVAMTAAITLLPHLLATHASQETAASVTEARVPAPSSESGKGASTSKPATGSSAPSPNQATIAKAEAPPSQQNRSSRPPASLQGVSGDHPRPLSSIGKAIPVAVPANPPPPGPSKQIDQARVRMIQLDAKAEADRAGIQQIRSQRQAQGLNMLGDVLAAMNRMNALIERGVSGSSTRMTCKPLNNNMDRAEKEMGHIGNIPGPIGAI